MKSIKVKVSGDTVIRILVKRYHAQEIPAISPMKEIASFAGGLEKDFAAAENSAVSPLSNGFVEGTNNKLKMIKRTMYGRCGKMLLEA